MIGKIPKISAVYFIWNNKNIVYIGQSKRLNQRLQSHERIKTDDSISWLQCPDSLLLLTEQFYIDKLKPDRNGSRSNGLMCPEKDFTLDINPSKDKKNGRAKRGALSNPERSFIENNLNLKINQIASKIDKSIYTVSKYILKSQFLQVNPHANDGQIDNIITTLNRFSKITVGNIIGDTLLNRIENGDVEISGEIQHIDARNNIILKNKNIRKITIEYND